MTLEHWITKEAAISPVFLRTFFSAGLMLLLGIGAANAATSLPDSASDAMKVGWQIHRAKKCNIWGEILTIIINAL